MKKKFLTVMVLILTSTFTTYAQSTVGVGINTNSPTADLDIRGSMRLEHYTQAEGKILVSNSEGEVRWTAPFSLKFFSGVLPKKNEGLTLTEGSAKYTNAYITLRPGGYLFKTILLINNSGDLKLNQAVFVTTYLSDSPTDGTYTSDYIEGSAKEISGSLVGPSTYGLVDGNVAIRNTGTTEKKYYLWAKLEHFIDNTNTPTRTTVRLSDFASVNWGENVLYAIPIE